MSNGSDLFDCLMTPEERAEERRRRIVAAVRDYQTRQRGRLGQQAAGAVRGRIRKGRG